MATDYGLGDYGQPLQESGSLGLAPLPAQNMPAEPFVPPNAPQGNGLGLAPAVAPPAVAPSMPQTALQGRAAEDQQFLANLPSGEKFALMLQSFAAGVHGGPNPVDVLLAQRQKMREDTRAELSNTLLNVARGYDVLDKVADGPEKQALREMLGRQMPEMANVFAAHGSEDEKAVKEFLGNMTPSVQKYLTDKCSMYPGTKGRRECFVKTTNDDSERKHMESLSIQDSTPGATAKVAAFSKWAASAEGPAELKGADGKPTFNIATLAPINEKLKAAGDPNALSQAEMHAVMKTQESYAMYGLVSQRTQAAQQETAARAGETTAAIAARQAAKPVAPGKAAKAAAVVAPESTLSPEAIKVAAARYGLDGTFPPNMGRGAQGEITRNKILNAHAQTLREQGKDGEAARIDQLANKANAGALLQLTKTEQMVGNFEKTALANLERAVVLSDKVDRLGVPVFDRWIQAGRKNVVGAPDISRFHVANETFVNEYAKVMSGSLGNTPVSDSLRKEIHTLLATKDTKEQYKEATDEMKIEMHNRIVGFTKQKAELKDSMKAGGGSSGAGSSTEDGEKSTSKSGRPIVRRNGKWEYQ